MRAERKGRFEKKAISRTAKILKLMESLGNNKKHAYKDEDAKKIIRAMEEELQELKRKWNFKDNPK